MERRRTLLAQGILALIIVAAGATWLSSPGPASASGTAAVAGGGDHTCALSTGGSVRCWGDNDNGQLGNNTTADSATPVTVCVPIILPPIPFAPSGLASEAEPAGGICLPISGAADISAGFDHTCVATTGGNVRCWGENLFGQLGNGTTSDRDTPVTVCSKTGCDESLSEVVAVAAGDSHTCALTSGGTVQCWGDNSFGQLGNNTNADSTTPVTACVPFFLPPIPLAPSTATSEAGPAGICFPLSGVEAIDAGGDYTCALTTAGNIRCWGKNAQGQLGDGTTSDRDTPAFVCEDVGCVDSLSDAVDVAAGVDHTCALSTDGTVQCWGDNDNGQLGNDTTADSTTPVTVCVPLDIILPPIPLAPSTESSEAGPAGICLFLSNATDISAGFNHTCAVTTASEARCWGDNLFGQLGDGTTTDRDTPVAVCEDFECADNLSDVVAVSAGDDHTCVLTTEGSVKCWGNNDDGQLGDGTNTDRSSPVDVVDVKPAPAPTATATTVPATDTPTPTATTEPGADTPTPTATTEPGADTPTPTATTEPGADTPTPTATAEPGADTPTPSPGLTGDVDCSGIVNSLDALFILQYDAGLLASLPCPENADVNEDGNINSLDAALILQYDAGLLGSLPP